MVFTKLGWDEGQQEWLHLPRVLPQGPIPTWLLVVGFEALDPGGLEAPMGPLQHGLQLVLQRVSGAVGEGLASPHPGFLVR